jgi:hypothetical protein
MIPLSKEGRFAGTGGGGYGGHGAIVPNKCNKCGKSYANRKAMDSVHICPRCRKGGKR